MIEMMPAYLEDFHKAFSEQCEVRVHNTSCIKCLWTSEMAN